MRFLVGFGLLLYFFVVVPQGFSQGASDGIELRLQTSNNFYGNFGGSNLTPWVVAFVCFLLFAILIATLWPNETDVSPYERQRKFSRVDQLFFKVSGHVLSDDQSKKFVKGEGRTEISVEAKKFPSESLTLLGLSSGGCSFLGDESLRRGKVVLLNLDTLPDFPSKELVAAVKIVWVREEKTHGRVYTVAGGKFIYSTGENTGENVKKYLSYLMDEPAT